MIHFSNIEKTVNKKNLSTNLMKKLFLDQISKSHKIRGESEGIYQSTLQLFFPKSYWKHTLTDISFHIDEGECVGLLGPNGAGKSTLIKILCGIQTPSKGTVNILGYDPAKKSSQLFKSIAVVFGHKNSLWWDLPLKESFILTKATYDIAHHVYKKNLDELTEALSLSNVLERRAFIPAKLYRLHFLRLFVLWITICFL